MTAHINTNGDFLCLLIFNAYQTSDRSLRDNRCASTRSLKAFGLKVFVRLNKLLVGSHVEDRTQTHRKINRPPTPTYESLQAGAARLDVCVGSSVCDSMLCVMLLLGYSRGELQQTLTVGSEGESPRMSSGDVALPCRRGSHLNPLSVSISAENRLVRMVKITRKRKNILQEEDRSSLGWCKHMLQTMCAC